MANKTSIVFSQKIKIYFYLQAEIPYDTRQLSLKNLIGNLRSCMTNLKNGNINKFNLTFKSKKNNNQIFFVNKKAINGLEIFKKKLKNGKLKTRNRHKKYLKYKIDHDFIILKEYNKYYIIIPKKRNTKFKKANYGAVSLDPGVRTFQTYYSPNGVCGEIGKNFNKLIKEKLLKIDKLKSIKEKIKNKTGQKKTKYNIKKRISLLRTKMKNKVRDMHWQSCSFLVNNFQNIIIPKFASHKMSNKINRNITKITTREMLYLSHYKFLEKLKFKCVEYQRNLILTAPKGLYVANCFAVVAYNRGIHIKNLW